MAVSRFNLFVTPAIVLACLLGIVSSWRWAALPVNAQQRPNPKGLSLEPLPKWSARGFYLTKELVQGDKALTACAAGYHMASLGEIFAPSTLRYDTTLGFTTSDSGFGPPGGTVSAGWFRTGGTNDLPGTPKGYGRNCQGWTSGDSFAGGTLLVFGPPDIGPSGLSYSPWVVTISRPLPGNTPIPSVSCGQRSHVWCVQD